MVCVRVFMCRVIPSVLCYRKALETDMGCVCALHQSLVVNRQQVNTQAEIQALHLIHSVSNTQTHTHTE